MEETLKYQSFHDSLTDLYNRAYFEEELQRLTNSRDYLITMISTDINGLKLINDTIGHQKGDQLLKAAASVLKESLRNSDMLARIGGDEFFAILSSTNKKTDEEWKVMCEHPEKGYRIASSSPELSGIANLILKHHEKWDGTGYPLGIKGTTIPIKCRILSIVDAFDAMTSDRPYRKANSRKKAIEELKKCTGTQFDPELIKVFLSILEKYASSRHKR